MKRTITMRIAAIGTVVGLLTAVPGVALAQTDTEVDQGTEHRDTFDRIKQRALAAIDERLDAIARWTSTVEGGEVLSRDHQARLLADLSAAERGLAALADDIEAAETYSELGELVPKIVEDYWVFALLGPKVHLVIAANVLSGAAERFETAAAAIQDAVDRAGEAGFDVAEAQQALDRMQTHITAALTLAGPVPNNVLNLQPKDMPEAAEQLRAAHVDLVSAREELRAARQAGHEALQALREASGAAGPEAQ